MPATTILQEAQQLYNVSDHLDSLSEQHPLVSEALITISGSVRNTATLLEVLVAMKLTPLSGLNPANAWFARPVSGCRNRLPGGRRPTPLTGRLVQGQEKAANWRRRLNVLEGPRQVFWVELNPLARQVNSLFDKSPALG